MRIQITVLAAVLSAGAFAQAIQAGSGGYGAGSTYSSAYDLSRQTVFSGKVVGESTYKPMSGMADAMSILVKTPKGATVEVTLGPKWYVSNQVAHVNLGEKVRVIGASATINNARVVLAKQIVNTSNNHVLALRDLSGRPYWVAARMPDTSSTPVPVPANAVGGTVQSLNTININGVPFQGYVLKTGDGTVNVVTGPSWYMNAQDYSIPVGTYVNVVGGAGPINLGNGVILADTMYTGGTAIVLQNNGLPVWYGYGHG